MGSLKELFSISVCKTAFIIFLGKIHVLVNLHLIEFIFADANSLIEPPVQEGRSTGELRLIGNCKSLKQAHPKKHSVIA